MSEAFKGMTLQEICDHFDKDYDELLMVCEIDCKKEYVEGHSITFEDYFKLHMVRVLAHIRSNPKNIHAYFI